MKPCAWGLFAFLFLALMLAACGPAPQPATPTPAPPASSPTPAPTSTPTPYPTPDLSPRPLVWFGPLPPLPVGAGRPFSGSLDFMDLFKPDAPWQTAAEHVQVFKLFGEWVAYNATDAELRQVFSDLARRGIAADVDGGPLTAPADCGAGVEGFAGIREGRLIANRVKAAGGTINLIDMDEPFVDASIYDGPNACHWTAQQVAQGVYEYVRAMHKEFPNAIVGTSEPFWKGMQVEDLENYIEVYKQVSGSYFPFFHLDLDYSIPDWPQVAKDLEAYCRERGIDFGMYYVGNWNDTSDEAWLAQAGERVKTYEVEYHGRPDHVIFQSWNDHPDYSLPETEANTFTNFVDQYFEDKSGLGVRTTGVGANLAFGKQASASRSGAGFEPARAVDGNPETWWGAGAAPPQWVEVDLGTLSTVASIRLTISQSPAGATDHRLLVKGPDTGGFVLAQEFKQVTADFDVLTFSPSEPLQKVQYIRVETVDSPSWVSWREIEVISAR